MIAWFGGVPILTYLQPAAAGVDLLTHADTIWRQQVRFIGAGTIGVAATVDAGQARQASCRWSGRHHRLVASNGNRRRAGSKISVQAGSSVSLWPAWCSPDGSPLRFIAGTPLAPDGVSLTAFAVIFVLIVGFLIAGICGYMAGLIGASNSPISGVGILSIVTCAAILLLFVAPSTETRPALVAFALFVTAIVFACATISNDNLQDLKTGQLVGASPWRQQVALIVGVGAGAVVIPPVLNLLARAYGFAGAANLNVVAANPLPAPQATLISALAQGVIGGNLDWKMIGIGALVGLAIIAHRRSAGRREAAADPTAGRRHRDLPADVRDLRGRCWAP